MSTHLTVNRPLGSNCGDLQLFFLKKKSVSRLILVYYPYTMALMGLPHARFEHCLKSNNAQTQTNTRYQAPLSRVSCSLLYANSGVRGYGVTSRRSSPLFYRNRMKSSQRGARHVVYALFEKFTERSIKVRSETPPSRTAFQTS